MKKDRLNMLMYVEFEYGNYKEEVDVWIPFSIFIDAVRKFADFSSVNLDGTDTSIWNFLVDLGCIDNLEDDENFISYCKELYKGSSFEEEDYEEWKDEYEFDHNLGKYSEES